MKTRYKLPRERLRKRWLDKVREDLKLLGGVDDEETSEGRAEAIWRCYGIEPKRFLKNLTIHRISIYYNR